jgi:hypothetical protein
MQCPAFRQTRNAPVTVGGTVRGRSSPSEKLRRRGDKVHNKYLHLARWTALRPRLSRGSKQSTPTSSPACASQLQTGFQPAVYR